MSRIIKEKQDLIDLTSYVKKLIKNKKLSSINHIDVKMLIVPDFEDVVLSLKASDFNLNSDIQSLHFHDKINDENPFVFEVATKKLYNYHDDSCIQL